MVSGEGADMLLLKWSSIQFELKGDTMRWLFTLIAVIVSLALSIMLSLITHAFVFLLFLPLIFVPLVFRRTQNGRI
jgi:hypothetical protein